jgi:predicted permease
MSLRLALRQLVRRPVFALSAIISIALGLGVNTTIFSVANGILLQAPPVERPDEMVRVYFNNHSPFTFPAYRFLKERNGVFTHVIAEVTRPVSLSLGDESQRISVGVVSGDYFAATGRRAALGTLPSDGGLDEPSPVPQVVLSHRAWSTRFGSDAGIVGRTIRLNERPFTVAGVAPEGFTSAQVLWAPDAYVSLGDTPTLLGRDPDVLSGSLYLSARLRPGVSRAEAATEARLLFTQYAADDSAALARQTWRVAGARGITAEVRGPVGIASGFLLAIAVMVLVVACANVGNLVLARNAGRKRELAVRAALGARRSRIASLLLSEILVLAAAGAMLALLATRWSAAILSSLVPPDAGVQIATAPDGRVLLFTLTLVGLTVLVAGLVPALQATRTDLTTSLREGSTGSGVRSTRLRRAFLGAQVLVTTVLLACAGLFLRSLQASGSVDVGFPTEGVANARLDLGEARTGAETALFMEQLEQRLAALPGVTGVTSASMVPLTGENSETGVFQEGIASDRPTQTYFNRVGVGYFGTMRIPLVAGREFAATDRQGAAPVVIVNETFARRFWPDGSPLGRRIRFAGDSQPWMEVIGVARDIRYNTLGETTPVFLYAPFAQSPTRSMAVHLRLASGVTPVSISRDVVGAVRLLDPSLPPPTVRALEEEQRIVLLPAQIGAGLTGAFGMLALLLAGVGIFGVAAFAVAQRTRELGIRSALGAQAPRLVLGVLTDTVRTVAIGGAAGLLLALGLARLLSSQLYGVSAFDPVIFVSAPLLLILVSTIATLIPAQRAARVNPVDALRTEG